MECSVFDLNEILQHADQPLKKLSKKNIFLTGGTGFFGKWIIESFLYANKKMELNSTLTVLTRDKNKFLKMNPHLQESNFLFFIEGDIRSFVFPNKKYNYIIHAAAQTSPSNEGTLLNDTISVIVDGTKHILDFAKATEAENLLFISSGAVYGKQPVSLSQISEDCNCSPSTTEPSSAYGEAKRLAELLCCIASSQFNLEIKIARCFAFVGPHLPLEKHFAIGNFIRDILLGKDVIVKGDGSPFRSYLYGTDLMIWLWTILVEGKNNHAYNVGSDKAISIGELANLISNLSNSKSKVVLEKKFHGLQPGERYVPSIEKAYHDLKLKPTVSLEEAILRTLHWYETIQFYS